MVKDRDQGKQITIDSSVPPGTETIKYKIKLKDGGVLKDMDRATSEVTVLGMYVNIVNAYTSDYSGLEHVQFSPGDKIFYHIIYNLEGKPGKLYKVKGIVKAFGQGLVSKQKYPEGSNYHMIIEGEVPEINPGEYTVKYKLKMLKRGVLLDKKEATSQIYVTE